MEVDSAIGQEVDNGLDPAREGQSKTLAVFALAGLSAVFLASVLFNPYAGEYFTVCGFKNLTGLPCPGCGLTHSFCALGKGDFASAFGFNLFGPVLFFGLVVIWIRSASVLMDKSSVVQLIDQFAERFNLVRAFVIGLGAYGIARIIYLLAYRPLTFHDSPLSQLIARLIH